MKIYTIANIIKAEVEIVFDYSINKENCILVAVLYTPPTQEQIGQCVKCGFKIIEKKLFTKEQEVVDIWQISHINEEEIENVTIEKLLHDSLQYDVPNKLFYNLTYNTNNSAVKRLLTQFYHDWDMCPTEANKLCQKYTEYLTQLTKTKNE